MTAVETTVTVVLVFCFSERIMLLLLCFGFVKMTLLGLGVVFIWSLYLQVTTFFFSHELGSFNGGVHWGIVVCG
jgi:hypothetical protein